MTSEALNGVVVQNSNVVFVFVEFHFDSDSKKSGAQDVIEIKNGLETTSDDIFHNINSLPIHIKHNLNSERESKTLYWKMLKYLKSI